MRLNPLLPVIISVPHGGTKIPREAMPYCSVDKQAILRDGDTWSRELYALSDSVTAYLESDIARAIIDMNRAPDDIPPENPDGVVKSLTVDRVQVWKRSEGPSKDLSEHLIRSYHRPYHEALEKFSGEGKALLGIDCHTMLPSSPRNSPGQENVRPLICISNRGNGKGEEMDEPLTASTNLVLALRDALEKEFFHEGVEIHLPGEPIGVNEPFRGGYICRRHGDPGSIPWIQFEINRALYMPAEGILSEYPDRKTGKRLAELREKFLRGLKSIL